MAEAGQGSDADALLRIQGHAPHFVNAVDGDELRPGTFPLPHLDQHVGAAGENLGLGMLQAQAHRVPDRSGLI